MAKTPAFLFYPADFLVGVMDMTDAEVGKYIRALCYQHAKGHLKQTTYDALPEAVKEKFVQDEEGKWYNIRLQIETDKRSAYSESRTRNRKNEKTYEEDMKSICNAETATYEKHMKNISSTYEYRNDTQNEKSYEVHMENENENIKEIKGNKKEKGEYEGEKKKKRDAFEEFAAVDTELLKALRDFEQMRTKIKKPLTERAKEMLIEKLKTFPPDHWVRILEQSVMHDWQGIFELKGEKQTYSKNDLRNIQPAPDTFMSKEERMKMMGGKK